MEHLSLEIMGSKAVLDELRVSVVRHFAEVLSFKRHVLRDLSQARVL
eukprot:CAMPEP_0173067076 /NCGR_PEP_ID=MMETSP1102-20130122/6602_2 /TAXON_ID=49646 /ORGANISM="Geminigera sp., Strain Caron Lab Isolate" /LENGTH=46 /DNA_ID= /DNA_START= /DNA_END= /DNA_ORIENTATION=